MTRSILKIILTPLALVLLFAGSFNLNGTNATASENSKTFCATYCPKGGPMFCAMLILPDGTEIRCGEPKTPETTNSGK